MTVGLAAVILWGEAIEKEDQAQAPRSLSEGLVNDEELFMVEVLKRSRDPSFPRLPPPPKDRPEPADPPH